MFCNMKPKSAQVTDLISGQQLDIPIWSSCIFRACVRPELHPKWQPLLYQIESTEINAEKVTK